MIAIQTFINLGGVSGLIPITGVPLPFISYGAHQCFVINERRYIGECQHACQVLRKEEKREPVPSKG